ncbi:MAG: EAL domain-containing protein [Janthinobacterium lividum]
MIKSIVELGHELEMRVVAEGVESEREARLLRTMGCNELQGVLFSKALPAEQLWAWVQARGQLEAHAMTG